MTRLNLSRRDFLRAGSAAALAASAGLLAACDSGSGDAGSDAGGSEEETASLTQEIRDRGVLNVGCKNDVPGYGYLNPSTGKYEGLEIELSMRIAAELFDVSYDDVKAAYDAAPDEAGEEYVTFTSVTPQTRGPLIDNGTLDMIAATYTITDERRESYDFSTPYRTDSVGMLVKTDSGMSALEDLDGAYVGVSSGSTTQDAITEMLADQGVSATPVFQEFQTYPEIDAALDAGTIDVFSVDRSILGGYVDDSTELLCPDVIFGPQDYGIATRKGSDFSDFVDEFVQEAQDSGELDEMIESYDLL